MPLLSNVVHYDMQRRVGDSTLHSPMLWSSSSRDLNPMDYKMWSVMQKVYKRRINDVSIFDWKKTFSVKCLDNSDIRCWVQSRSDRKPRMVFRLAPQSLSLMTLNCTRFRSQNFRIKYTCRQLLCNLFGILDRYTFHGSYLLNSLNVQGVTNCSIVLRKTWHISVCDAYFYISFEIMSCLS